MSDSYSKEFIKKNLKKCVRCGLCLAACPVYSFDRDESSSPRGRLHIIDKLSNKKIFDRYLNNCLLCMSCRDACPNGVDVSGVIRESRSVFRLSRTIYKMAKPIQGKDFRRMRAISDILNIDRNIGGLLRISSGNRNLPEVSKMKIRYNNTISENTIAIFTGCLPPIFYPELINRIADYYTKKGFNVYIPENQNCCGLMNYSAGDDKKALYLAARNTEIFSSDKIKKIVTICASCAYMLSKYNQIIKGGEIVSEKIYTLDDIIIEQIVRTISVKEERSAIHIPCHIRNSERYRALYKRLKSLDKIADIKVIDRCCGYGGVFNLYEYRKSIKIGEGVMSELDDRRVLYTLCSGCYMQFYDLAEKSGMKIKIFNIAELI